MSFAIADAFMGGGPDYAAAAQSAEDRRQGAVTSGTKSINDAFSGFNPQFYKNRQQAYVNFALPQLGEQYQQARNDIGFGIANRGQYGGSNARKQWSDLFRTNQNARQGIADAAIGQSNDLRKQVAGQKSSLLGQLYASADPANAQSASIGAAASLQQPSVYGPLANQFSGLINQYYMNSLLNPNTPTTGTTGTTPSYGAGFAPIPN